MTLSSKPTAPIAAFVVPLGAGAMFGSSIGMFGVINTWKTHLSMCDQFVSVDACEGASVVGGCHWQPTAIVGINSSMSVASDVSDSSSSDDSDSPVAGECQYAGDAKAVCGAAHSPETCTGIPDADCQWDISEAVCTPYAGWAPTLTGLLNAALVAGGMAGGQMGGVLMKRGRRPALLAVCLVSLVGQLLTSVGWHWDQYATLVSARCLCGVANGVACVTVPIYVAEMQGRHGWIGAMFQVSMCLGMVLVALTGYILDPTEATSETSRFGSGAHTQGMLHVVIHAVATSIAVVMIPVVALIPESMESVKITPEEVVVSPKALKPDEVTKTGGCRQLMRFIVPITALCGCLQLTGINSIMSFAPQITAASGLQPLQGNFYVMLWNFVTALVAIPILKKFTPKRMFNLGAILLTLTCFLTFVLTFPAIITNETVSQWLTGGSILLFVGCFEVSVGPTFFIVAQDMFPDEVKEAGTSLTITVAMAFSVLIGFIYPVLVKAFSGVSNDQQRGMSYTFLLFGLIGAICSTVLLKFLPKLRSEIAAEESLSQLDGVMTLAAEAEPESLEEEENYVPAPGLKTQKSVDVMQTPIVKSPGGSFEGNSVVSSTSVSASVSDLVDAAV